MRPRKLWVLWWAIAFVLAANVAFAALNHQQPIIPNLPVAPTLTVSTIPPNGDVNPYGVAFVPNGFAPHGVLRPGDILVSNFNDFTNTQGTGTTIVRITQSGQQSVFFQGAKGLGLTTALGILKKGFVLVGNLPTANGTGPCGVGQGSLLIIDKNGNLIQTLTSAALLDGPWDLTIREEGNNAQVFVSNVSSGTVTRIDLRIADARKKNPVQVLKETQIASGYVVGCDPSALVIGPTGLAYDKAKDILYVASTGDNKIFAVANARRTTQDLGTGTVVVQDQTHLHGPLGLALAPNGDLICSQGDAVNPDPNQPSEIVEFTSTGAFVAQFSIDSAPGSAFGVALVPFKNGFIFAAVDDGLNVLDIWVVH